MKGVAELQLNLRVRQVKTGGKGEKGLCFPGNPVRKPALEKRGTGKKQWNLGSGSSFLKLHTDSRSMSCTGTLHILGELFSGILELFRNSRQLLRGSGENPER